MNKVKLSEVANVELSSIDKKIVQGEKSVKLCNFTDVYYNWAITKSIVDKCMKGSVNESEFSKFALKKGQVAITKDSETRSDIGMSTYISEDFDDAVLAYHCALITPKEGKVNGKYLNALLNDSYGRKYFANQASGSGQRYTLSKEAIESIKIPLPSMEKQNAIGSFFSDIDRKIELNNCINDNLYKQLELIFRYECKAEVKHPNNVLSDICSYSADKIAVSELTVFSYYSTENMLPNKAGAIDSTNLPTCNLTTKCHNGDTLISNIRPYFRKIAYVTNVAGCSSDVLCFTPKEKHLSAFLFCTLYEDCFFDYMLAGNKGTKMPRGDKQLIMKYPVSIPSPNNLRTFNEVAAPILELISLHKMANKELYNLRNSLLPLLINGQATISV